MLVQTGRYFAYKKIKANKWNELEINGRANHKLIERMD